MSELLPQAHLSLLRSSVLYSPPFLPPRIYPLLRSPPALRIHSNLNSFAFFLVKEKGVIVCVERGLKGGGAGKSKSASNSFKESSRVNTEDEAETVLQSLSSSLSRLDAGSLLSSCVPLQSNSSGTDSKLLALIIPSFTFPGFLTASSPEWPPARLSLAVLLRISAVRHAIRHNAVSFPEIPALIPILKAVTHTISARYPSDTDLQAELMAAYAVLASLNTTFWVNLQTILPHLANFRNCSDPIEVIGHLVERLKDLTKETAGEYKRAKQDSQISVVMMLTVMRHARRYLSMRDVEVLYTALERCQVWWVAVLLIRLASECVEEAELPLDIRTKLCSLLGDFLGFKRFYLRNNWKVRRSALLNLLRIKGKRLEKATEAIIVRLVSQRLHLENDPKVKSAFASDIRNAKPATTDYSKIVFEELADLCANVHRLYGSLHMKDGARTGVIAAEIDNAGESLEHLITLMDREGDMRAAETARIEVQRAKDIARIVSSGKTINPISTLEPDLFLGRQAEISNILSLFRSPPAHIAILGPPGIGKTALVRHILSLLKSDPLFDKFVWLNAENSISLCHSLLISHESDPSPDYTQQLSTIRDALRTNPRVILVYDKADFAGLDASQEIDSLIRSLFDFKQASVIVTSRNDDWSRAVPTTVRLAPLSDTEANSHLATASRLNSFSPRLAAVLGGNPSLNVVAAGYLKQSKNLVPLEQHLEGSGTTLERLFRVIIRGVNPQTRLLACALSSLYSDFISDSVVQEIAAKMSLPQTVSLLAELESVSFLVRTPSGIQLSRPFQDCMHPFYPDTRSQWEPPTSESLISLLKPSSTDIATILQCRAYHSRRKDLSIANFTIDQAVLKFCITNGLEVEAAVVGRKITVLPNLSDSDKLELVLQQAEANERTGNYAMAESAYSKAYMLTKAFPKIHFDVTVKLAHLKHRANDIPSAQQFSSEAVSLMSGLSVTPEVQFEVVRLAGELFAGSEQCLGFLEQAVVLLQSLKTIPRDTRDRLKMDLAETYFACRREGACVDILTELLREMTAQTDTALVSRIFELLAQTHTTNGMNRLELLTKELEFRRDSLLKDKRRLVALLSDLSSLTNSGEILRASRLYASQAQGNPGVQQTAVALIHAKDYQLFDCEQMALCPKVRLSATIKSDHLSAYIVLRDGTLFVCGGGEYKTLYDTAYRIHTNGTVQGLMKMIRAKQAHGLVECFGQVFAFGGETKQHEPVSFSEKLDLSPIESISKQKWVKLANMLNGRSCFNPVVFDEKIYLVGGNTTKGEVFDPQTGVFELLPVTLPEGEDTCSLLLHSELLIISCNFLIRLHLSTHELTSQPRPHWTDAVKKWNDEEQSWDSETLYIGCINGVVVDSMVVLSVYDHIRVVDVESGGEKVIQIN